MSPNRSFAITYILLVLSVATANAEPLSRKESVQLAVASNPNLAESHIGIAVAEKGVESAFGKHYPRLTLEASIAQRKDPVPYIPAQSPKILAHYSDSSVPDRSS